MDSELKQFYNDARALFETDGWRNFVEDMGNAFLGLNDITSVRGSDDLFFRQGQANIINFVLGYQTSLEAAEREADADEEEENA